VIYNVDVNWKYKGLFTFRETRDEINNDYRNYNRTCHSATVIQNDTNSRLGITMTDQKAEFGKLVWPHAHHIVQPHHVLDNLHIHTLSAPAPTPNLRYQLTFLSDDLWTLSIQHFKHGIKSRFFKPIKWAEDYFITW
jgi:hypothetical protein